MYLIDTDIMVYALNGVPEVVGKFEALESFPKAISIITYGELLYGALKSGRRPQNVARVRRIAELFPILDVSRAVIDVFASLKVDLEGKGTRLDDFDLLIASTALVHGHCLVTNNVRHFGRVPGLDVENWVGG